MTSIDLKDALYLVPLYENHQPYLIFFAKEIFKFVYMATDQLWEYLQEFSEKQVFWPDLCWWFIFDDSYEGCFSNFLNTIEILRSLGFVIHPNKSSITSS